MSISIKKYSIVKLVMLMAYGVFSAFLLKWLDNRAVGNPFSWLGTCARASILLLIVQCIIMRVLKYRILSLEFVFLVLVYAFYLGQLFLISISYDFGELSYSVAYIAYGLPSYILSTRYSLTCITVVFLGMMLGSNNVQENNENISFKGNSKMDVYAARVMLLLSAPFELSSIILKIRAMLTGAYLDAHSTGGGVLVEFMSGIFFASLMYFLMSASDNGVKQKKVFLAIILYEAMTLLTGQRAMGVIKIFLCVLVYYSDGKKLRWKTALKLFVGVIFASYVLVVIRNSRLEGFSLRTLRFTSNGFLPFDVLSEFGITGRVITATIFRVTEFAKGKSLICGFLAIVPGWSNLFGNDLISKYYTYVALDQQAWGSSFVSDFYFDFGYNGGIIASCIYAFIIGKVFCRFKKLIAQHDYVKASCYAYFVSQLIFTIRSYVFRLPRYFLYFMVIFWLCSTFTRLIMERKYSPKRIERGEND